MKKKFSFFKFLTITVLFFILLDLLIGNYIYKKFIRLNFVDVDLSVGIRDKVFDHNFKSSYKTNRAGWGPIRFTICTDPNGFRTNCNNQYRNLKKFDIAFIGDSFTEPVGINYEDSFVGIIEDKLKNKKIANLAITSYSPSIYFSKINYLISKGFSFKEIIVFLDISDIRDDTICYKLEKNIVERRKDLSCLRLEPTLNEKFWFYFKKRFRLSFELYNVIEINLYNQNIINFPIPKKVLDNPRSNWTHNYDKTFYRNLELSESTGIALKNMELLSKLLKDNGIDLSVAVYPWPGTLKYDVVNNQHLKLWENFCVLNCKKFYNLMIPFFKMKESEGFSSLYKRVYIKNDVHFNKEGNNIIAKNFLKMYLN
jgi:hypothetical protein